jgi:hypothetical protein
MEARNRKIDDWYGKIDRGEIKLPRFQRYEAWDKKRISSLFNTIVKDLPLGITLVLEVGEKEQFISRFLVTAPASGTKVLEQLLDGQQRLTALWRVLHNNYEDVTYFVYVPEFDDQGEKESDEQFIYYKTRYLKRNGQRYPLWCDEPAECLKRGMIPTNLLRPVDMRQEIDKWIDAATSWRKPRDLNQLESFFDWKKKISDKVNEFRATIKNYNLPYLSLPTSTSKDIALNVFINMNTNSEPLTTYDVIVAEVEEEKGQSLHELQQKLDRKFPNIKHYYELSYLILNTSALMQDKLPSQRGLWEMDKSVMVDQWDAMENGLNEMSIFLLNEGIIDKERLPTNAVLAVIAALYSFIPIKGDERGVCENLLRKYLWSAFFTDRYENSAATRAFSDYLGMKKVIKHAVKPDGSPFNEIDIPVLNRQIHPLADEDELRSAPWPKSDTIRGKAILAIACRLGSTDFATAQKIDRTNIDKRQYHHIYPDALLSEAGIESYLALNCALITDSTNWDIGRKDPLVYLKDRYKWVSEEIVNDRLNSHLIPIRELANGGYQNCSSDEERKQKITNDFNAFMKKRARFFTEAAKGLVEGKQISSTQIIDNCSREK